MKKCKLLLFDLDGTLLQSDIVIGSNDEDGIAGFIENEIL